MVILFSKFIKKKILSGSIKMNEIILKDLKKKWN